MVDKDGRRRKAHVRLRDGLLAGVQCNDTRCPSEKYNQILGIKYREYYVQYTVIFELVTYT